MRQGNEFAERRVPHDFVQSVRNVFKGRAGRHRDSHGRNGVVVTWSGMMVCRLSVHSVRISGGCGHWLQHIPVLDNLAIVIEAEDVDSSGFLATPIQIAHVHKGEISIYLYALDLAWDAPRLFDIGHRARRE
jgi:hypothetical protein